MSTSSAISLTFEQRKEKRVLSPFSGAFFHGGMRLRRATEVGLFPDNPCQ